jgi:hypothetical protein
MESSLFTDPRAAKGACANPRATPPTETQFTLFDFGLDERSPPAAQAQHTDIRGTSPARNYRITPADRIGQGGLHQKAEDNLRAVRLLTILRAEGRGPTIEEQSVLVRFVGWGALPQVFEEDHPEWGEIGRELRTLLSAEDYDKAAASTPNAHYTSETVIRGIYGILAGLGFAGGRVLEPALGIGHFIGFLPDEIVAPTRWTGIELDPTTGRIAQALYPECDIRIQGFEDVSLADGTFDVVLGNVPFGRYPVHDPVHNPHGFRIHDTPMWGSAPRGAFLLPLPPVPLT